MNWRRLLRATKLFLLVLTVILLLAPEWPAFAGERYGLRQVVGQREFDFLVWESNAFLDKGESALAGGQRYLDEATRQKIVLDYLELTREARRLEQEINALYVDPEVEDPEESSKELQSQLADVRREIENKQLLAEAIIQEQVGSVLMDEGFELLGQAWPPVLMRVTELPWVLIVSPRDHIEKLYQVNLVTGLTTAEKEKMETAVFNDLDLAALVVPIGGVGTYPSMILETSDINRLAEVVSHEWGHHWLTLKPLGFNYAFDPAVRIINETVASLIDEELGQRVVERYYPEYLPSAAGEQPLPAPDDPLAFDFGAEMAETRIKTDALLAEGKVDEAEAYMEERRQLFVEQGYAIRKLNQAYFAFYSAYAAEPGGAQGDNPIGPMLRDIRDQSPSIRAFLDTVAPITSFADLQEIHKQVMSPADAAG
jgi:hypothetical protein